MRDFFRPYEGRKPFVFVSYSHLDSDCVLDIITPLHEQKYRVWYDEGIPAGSDWPKNIDVHMRAAAAVLFFISMHSISSDNCYKEMREAVRQSKAILCVRLDASELTEEWKALIGHSSKLTVAIEPRDTARAVLEQGTIGKAYLGDGTNDPIDKDIGIHFNGWILASIAGILLLVATATGTYGLANNWFDRYLPIAQENTAVIAETAAPTAAPTPVPTINLEGAWASMLSEYASFPDKQQERAIRAALDQASGDVLSGDLLQIKQLHVCGNMTLKSDDGIVFDRAGNCFVNSAPVMQGDISDLSLIADMLALERLSLVCQQIESLASLSVLTRLTELNAAGNPIADIGNLSGMASLQTLHLEHTKVKDLSVLNGLGRLETVTVSADMFPLTFDAATQKFDVVLVP